MKRPFALALVSLLVAGPLAAQSLAELAAKEKERRKKASASTRKFTDEDLKKVRTAAGPASEPTSSGAVDRPESSSDATVGQGTRESWQAEAQQFRDAISEAEKGVAVAQKNLDAARTGVGQPQPSDGLRQLPVNPLIKEPAYEAAEKELADARAAVDVARAALAAFEEKARKAGVPPGWLR
jgi:hypothetical protein